MSFQNLGLSEDVIHGVQSMGYMDPTPIQLQAFPIILGKKDHHRRLANRHRLRQPLSCCRCSRSSRNTSRTVPRILILEPTRELAAYSLMSLRKRFLPFW